jgi:hypothetical protein
MTTMMNKVFESLYREELAYTPPYVNIKFFTKYMTIMFSEANGCGVEIIKRAL